MASNQVLKVTDTTFDKEVINSNTPVLLDFTAVWCGPCQRLAPIVDEVAKEFDGKLKVAKLDIDDSPDTAARFGIRGVPTLMVFKGGKVVAQHVGMAPKKTLLALFQDHL